MPVPIPTRSDVADPPVRKSFRELQFAAREEAILQATSQLMGSKGYETMCMGDIAQAVGIAKGSLYKHFDSKEALAAAVTMRLVQRVRAVLDEMPPEQAAIETLRQLLVWTLRERLAGGVPHLPSICPVLREHLRTRPVYAEQLNALSHAISALIDRAREAGDFDPDLDSAFVLYYLYARACEPTLDVLQAHGPFSDDQIIGQIVSTALQGLAPSHR